MALCKYRWQPKKSKQNGTAKTHTKKVYIENGQQQKNDGEKRTLKNIVGLNVFAIYLLINLIEIN